MSEFLESELSDDVVDERAEFSLLYAEGLGAAFGEIRLKVVDAVAEGAPCEEVGFQELEIEGELEKIDVGLGESLGGGDAEEEEEEEEGD